MSIKVSFMFLGGLPNPEEDAGKAWREFLELSTKKYYKNIVFAVHPIKPTDKIRGFWRDFLNTTEKTQRSKIRTIFINQPSKHLKTAWATRSLVDVSVTMIKESYDLAPTIEKFILIEGKTCPLYNLSVLYETVTASRKNWFDPLNNSCRTTLEYNEHPNMYCDDRICLNQKDCSFWSQWMILDSKYIQSILRTNIEKDKKPVNCNGSIINQIIVPKLTDKNSRILNQSLVEMLDINQKPCTFADELYFGLYLKRGKTINEFLKIIKTRSLKRLRRTYDEIEPLARKPARYVQAPDNTMDWSIVHAKGVAPIANFANPQKIQHYQKEKSKLDKYSFYITEIKFNDRKVSGLFSTPSVYVDWRYFNPSPRNIFRSFDYPGFNLSKYLDMEVEFGIKTLLKLSISPNVSFESTGMLRVPYWSHPLEYNTDFVEVFINGYNFLEYLHKTNPDDYQFSYLRDIYPRLFDQIGVKIIYKNTKKYKFAFIEPTQIKMGSYITSDVLNQARMRGCLFIRKCERGSAIHLYADQLYSRNSKYIYS